MITAIGVSIGTLAGFTVWIRLLIADYRRQMRGRRP